MWISTPIMEINLVPEEVSSIEVTRAIEEDCEDPSCGCPHDSTIYTAAIHTIDGNVVQIQMLAGVFLSLAVIFQRYALEQDAEEYMQLMDEHIAAEQNG